MQRGYGYRGNPNLKRPGQAIHWTNEMVSEWIKCSDDPIYFIETYMKITDPDGKMVNFKLYDYQRKIIESYHKNRNTISCMARQSGKALPLDTEIPTPLGWRTIEELEVGDEVFDENGKPVKIIATSPIFINRDCYKITFDDGSNVIADAQHLWTVEEKSRRRVITKTISTQEIYNLNPTKVDSRNKIISKWRIPLAKPIQYKDKEVKIDPYLLGVWLGDGEAASGRITCQQSDLIEYKMAVGSDFSSNHLKSHIYTGTVYGLMPILRSYNLLKNKHIPKDYLFNSINKRIALLQGLMDTDGWVNEKQNCIALSYNRYPQLIEDVYELLTSLGLKVTRKHYHKTNSIRLSFHCSKEMFEVFKLKRKLDKQQIKGYRPTFTKSRFIRLIEKVKSVPTKCLTVNSHNHLFLCTRHFIPTHNSTTTCGFILWFINFHQNQNVAILANKGEIAMEILGRVQFAHQNLPKWIQQGTEEWNKGSFVLENGSRVRATATGPRSIAGFTVNFLFIDEAAHIENWYEFYAASSETIASSKKAKIALVSTPNGLNHFWEIFSSTEKNGYNAIKVNWRQVPGRDEKWKQEALARMNFDEEKFRQEHECEFLGSSGTLIAGWKLQLMFPAIPIMDRAKLRMWKAPVKGHTYVIVCDVSEGKGLDYNAFQVIDITRLPYEQVARFKDNLNSPIEYTETIYQTAQNYNEAAVLVENNLNLGGQIADMLYDKFEYEHVLHTQSKGRDGKQISGGFNKSTEKGIRTTKTVKAVGCQILKLLVEKDQLLINDSDTIYELSTFSRHKKSYEAEAGKHDDLVVGLFLFAWLSDQTYFKELTDINTLAKLREKSEEAIMEDLLPFGFVVDHQPIDPAEELELDPEDNWLLADDLINS